MKASIHAARFIDIGVDEQLNAAVPWHYRALDEQHRFATFDEAFEYYEGRVLLLGTPGSGKTTTLLNLALKLIAEARQDEAAPVPLLFNLSKFGGVSLKKVSEEAGRLRKRKEPGEEPYDRSHARVFEQWLVQMLVEMPVEGLNRQTAQQWVEGGQTALLLDGLDEVNDTHLLALAEIMNQTYLREHPLQPVVVCSRIIEYQPLQENRDARLRLNGGVALLPPTREQIDGYLEKAEAVALRDALRGDEVLYEMAQTPLTLSMMTLAYGGQAPTDISHDLPFLERRRELLDTYVRRMVQRTARRPAGIPFDLNPDRDVPPRYPLEQTFHYLGWLAVKLSERMKTLFPPKRLYSFLSEQPADGETHASGLRHGAAAGASWLVAALTNVGLLAGAGLAPRWTWLALVPLLAPLIVSLTALKTWVEGNPRLGANAATVLEGLRSGPVTLFALISLALVNRALLALLPSGTRPEVAAVLVIILLAFAAWLYSATANKTGRERARAVASRSLKFLSAMAAAGAIAAAAAGAEFALYGVAALGYAVVFWLMRSELDGVSLWVFSPTFIALSAGLVQFASAGGQMLGTEELFALAVAVTLLFGFLSSSDKWVGVPLSLSLAVVAANALGGAVAAVWAVAGVMLFHFGWFRAEAARAAEWLLLNPLLRVMLALGRRTCLRYGAFLDYAAETMLLKHVGTEYEFVHRLLRDHFAVRELIPLLRQAEGEKRIAVIQRLSRQGDSSFEALANLTEHPEANVRCAAIEGLGRIAIPAVLAIMEERILKDSDEGVRSAVVQSLGKFKNEKQKELFDLAMRDASVEVRRAAVAYCKDSHLLSAALNDESDIVFRQALARIAPYDYFYPDGMLHELTFRRLEEALRNADALVAMGAANVTAIFCREWKAYDAEGKATLTAFTARMLPPLLEGCKDKQQKVRKRMVEAVSSISEWDEGGRRRPEVKLALTRALKDRDSEVRKAAIPGLASLKSPDTLAALRASIKRGDDGYRRVVITQLGKVRDPLAVPALMKALGNPKLRYTAAVALGRIGDHSVVPELMRWLEGRRQSRRIPAVMALAALKASEAAPKLRRMFSGPPDGGVRYLGLPFRSRAEDIRPYAAKALGLLKDVEALPALSDISARAPSRLLFAQAQALSDYLDATGAMQMLAEKIGRLSAAEQDELLDKTRAFLRGDLPPELANEQEPWPLILRVMTHNYRGDFRGLWGDDWLFFIGTMS